MLHEAEGQLQFVADHLPVPVILPSSGIYRPPLTITILRGTDNYSDNDELFYSLQHSFSAEHLASSHAKPYTTGAGRYDGPLRIDHAGRVKLSVFQHREGIGKGRPAVALYMLEYNAPEAPAPSADTLRSAFPNAKLLMQQQQQQSSPNQPPPHEIIPQQIPVRNIVIPAALMFQKVPDRIVAYHPFEIAVQPVDVGKVNTFTVQVSIEMCTPPTDGSGTIGGSTMIRVEQEDFLTSNALKAHTVEWQYMRYTQTSNDGSSIGLIQEALIPQDMVEEWDCCAVSKEQPLAHYRAVRFVLNMSCRVIVGFAYGATAVAGRSGDGGIRWTHSPRRMHNNTNNTPSQGIGIGWRDVRHGIHINFFNGVSAFRVYESGVWVEAAGTHECRERDWFAVEHRHDGVAYIHNGDVFYFTPMKYDESGTFNIGVFIAGEMQFPSLTDLVLLPRNDPRTVIFKGLTWVPPRSVEDAMRQSIHTVPVVPGLIRAWLVGHPNCTTVTHKVGLQPVEIPRWAIMSSLMGLMFTGNGLGLRLDKAQLQMSSREARPGGAHITVVREGGPPLSTPVVPGAAPSFDSQQHYDVDPVGSPLRDQRNQDRINRMSKARATDMKQCLQKAAEWSELRRSPILTNRRSAAGVPGYESSAAGNGMGGMSPGRSRRGGSDLYHRTAYGESVNVSPVRAGGPRRRPLSPMPDPHSFSPSSNHATSTNYNLNVQRPTGLMVPPVRSRWGGVANTGGGDLAEVPESPRYSLKDIVMPRSTF